MKLQKQLEKIKELWLEYWQTLYIIDRIRGVIEKRKLYAIEFWSDRIKLFLDDFRHVSLEDVYGSKAEAKEVLKDIYLKKIKNIK